MINKLAGIKCYCGCELRAEERAYGKGRKALNAMTPAPNTGRARGFVVVCERAACPDITGRYATRDEAIDAAVIVRGGK